MNGEDRMTWMDSPDVTAQELLVAEGTDSPGQHISSPIDSDSPAPQDMLGEPLAIEQVAELLGCSTWTVRQRYLRQGLPHLQARPRGKLVFFREQVITWTLKRQRQKGGLPR